MYDLLIIDVILDSFKCHKGFEPSEKFFRTVY